MSAMLTCIITTLLTSCIDGDYFDFYDDENECSLIRRKRNKDSEGYAAYPEQFLEAEQLIVTNSGGNILDTKDLAIKGPGHIAKVDNVVDTEDTISGVITYNFFIVDQYSDYNYYPYPREHKDHYYIQIDRFGHLLGTDIECFIWKDKDES